jgi:translation initiation factor IF-3
MKPERKLKDIVTNRIAESEQRPVTRVMDVGRKRKRETSNHVEATKAKQ